MTGTDGGGPADAPADGGGDPAGRADPSTGAGGTSAGGRDDTSDDDAGGRSRLYGRVRRLATEARRERDRADPPTDLPAPDRATRYCRDGIGPVIAAYVEARTGEWLRLSGREMALLDRALNDWLELYALCYGVDIDAEFTVREAAELLVDTHSTRDVAALLTRVPER